MKICLLLMLLMFLVEIGLSIVCIIQSNQIFDIQQQLHQLQTQAKWQSLSRGQHDRACADQKKSSRKIPS